jgi:hypothetical protein
LVIITLLSLGMVFYAGRGFFLRFLQDLPKTWFLRNWACKWQLRSLRRAQREEEKLNWKLSAILWFKFNFNASEISRPVWLISPVAAKALQASQKARKIFEAPPLPGVGLERHYQYLVVEGLSSLRNWVAAAPTEAQKWQPELDGWNTLSDNAFVKKTFTDLSVDIQRKADQALARVLEFPHALWIKPTSLGNRLAVLDDYGFDRYGIHTSTLWTRLRYNLDAENRKESADAQLGVEVLSNISTALGLLALYSLALTLANLFSGTTTLASHFFPYAIFFSVFAWLAYRGAVFAFDLQSSKMIGLIDLNRRKVLTSMGFATPASLKEELELFGMLRGFFIQASKPEALLNKLPENQEPVKAIKSRSEAMGDHDIDHAVEIFIRIAGIIRELRTNKDLQVTPYEKLSYYIGDEVGAIHRFLKKFINEFQLDTNLSLTDMKLKSEADALDKIIYWYCEYIRKNP